MREVSDADLESVYEVLGQCCLRAHPRSYIRNISGMTIANTESVCLSCDGPVSGGGSSVAGFEPVLDLHVLLGFLLGLSRSRRSRVGRRFAILLVFA